MRNLQSQHLVLEMLRDELAEIPGIEYEVEQRNDRGDVISKRKQVAFAWVENARLSELSAVYDGATPGCAILKAQREADAGRMTPETAFFLEQRYRGLQLTAAHHRWPGYSATSPDQPKLTRGIVMAETTDLQPGKEPSAAQPAASAPAEQPAIRVVPDHQFERLVTELAEAAGVPETDRTDVRTVAAQLRQAVKDGLAYRERVITDALTEGVRLFGNEFDQEATRALFVRADCEHIRSMMEQWRKQADKLFPVGRQTLDDAEPPAAEKREAALPATYYGG